MMLNENRFRIALNEFARMYSSNPFECLYESDVQILLGRILTEHFKDTPHLVKKEDKILNLGKVHSEYPNNLLFDLVVLAELREGENNHLYDQNIQYAVELKLVPTGMKGVAMFDHSKDDLIHLVGKYKALKNGDQVEELVQLTVFHEVAQQRKFLQYHLNENWTEGLLRELSENSQILYQYVDLTTWTVRDVFDLRN